MVGRGESDRCQSKVVRHFTEIAAPQRSPEWHLARAGRLTGSRASDMLATIRSGEAAARRDYRLQLTCERLTGQPHESSYVNAEMQRGIDLEPAARGAYESAVGVLVRDSGFLAHNELMTGCSVDGDVDNYAGIVELKCPKAATHLRFIEGNVLPHEHQAQVRHNLWITGAQWCDFVSYDDRFPCHLRLFRVRVAADDLDLPDYEKNALKFLAEVQSEVECLQQLASSSIGV